MGKLVPALRPRFACLGLDAGRLAVFPAAWNRLLLCKRARWRVQGFPISRQRFRP